MLEPRRLKTRTWGRCHLYPLRSLGPARPPGVGPEVRWWLGQGRDPSLSPQKPPPAWRELRPPRQDSRGNGGGHPEDGATNGSTAAVWGWRGAGRSVTAGRVLHAPGACGSSPRLPRADGVSVPLGAVSGSGPLATCPAAGPGCGPLRGHGVQAGSSRGRSPLGGVRGAPSPGVIQGRQVAAGAGW